MAKWCPVKKEKVIYLECLECESKNICQHLKFNSYQTKKNKK